MSPFIQRLLLILGAVFGLAVFIFVLSSRNAPMKTFGPADSPVLSTQDLQTERDRAESMPRVADIAHDPQDLQGPVIRTTEDHVQIHLVAKEVIAKLAEGIEFPYWTFNGTVPGPFLRVREGDTVELTLTNDSANANHHNIDLHAVTGPGGGATATSVAPGESKTITFKALHPGLYVYHCAHISASTHMARGMFGMILVEPKIPLPKVDKEFYLMQGELYTTGNMGEEGLQLFDGQKMLNGIPDYVVFNGRVQGAVGNMLVKTGEHIRLYVGNGGVNDVSSLHIIGETMDTVYPEGALGKDSARLHDVQTTLIPAGGATVVDFTIEVPGKYIIVDHALARMDHGAWATIEAEGPPAKDIFDGIEDHHMPGH